MTTKIRRVDFSPAEWLAGTSSLTFEQQGLYWTVCALIYDQGAPVKNDPKWIARRAADAGSARTRRLLAELIAAKKLRLTDDGRLTNGRAESELAASKFRIKRAKNASEVARNSRESQKKNPEKSNEINEAPEIEDHPTINHQPSTNKERKKEPPFGRQERTRKQARAPTKQDTLPGIDSPTPKPNGATHGSRLAEDWTPSQTLRAFALGLGLDVDAEAVAFVDYWHAEAGQRASKRDWSAAFRTWCRRSRPGSRPGPGGNASPVRPSGGGGFAAAAARARDALQARKRERQ
jgi:uncharacterized protein YdaU (DUF1376 family)